MDDTFKFVEGTDTLEFEQFHITACQRLKIVDFWRCGIIFSVPFSERLAPNIDGLAGNDDWLDVTGIELLKNPNEFLGIVTF